ncbi:MAG: pentapeptide repeat-containing protein [Moorea sp. SIO3C2]|nr:pentapeptide repeat-containing protein [Moorena sp. SIO3C2]
MFSDFSGQNLRGRSFKGQNLTGANFNDADLRGVDFSNAILKGATFSHARSGLRYYWVILLLAFSLLLSVLSSHIFCRTGHISLKFMESKSPILQSAIAFGGLFEPSHQHCY